MNTPHFPMKSHAFLTRPLCILLAILLVAAFCLMPQAWALPATTTTLAVTSAGNTVTTVASGAVVELAATVTSSGASVTTGQVEFCDGLAKYCTDIHVLGTAQLTSAGTAVLRFYPGIGSHSYKAVFEGTPNGSPAYAGSTSGTEELTVTGTYPTTTAIALSGQVGDYSLTATVTALGSSPDAAALSGSVSFLDTTNNDLSLGTADLGAVTAGPSFLTSSSPATNPFPQSVAVADFNGDGKLDLAVPIYSQSTPFADVDILLGKGDGTFTTGPAFAVTGQNVNNAVVADFNGDGIPDLAISLPDAGQVQVLIGVGDGSFIGKPPITVHSVFVVATGDLNGDGKADLVTANCGAGTVTLLLGNGDGTFTAAGSPVAGSCPSSVAVGDFNGDGIADLAVANDSRGNGVPGSLTILRGNGDGTFTPEAKSPATGNSPASIAVGDLNGDGVLDLAVANLDPNTGNPSTVTVLLGNGDGTFTPTTASPVTAFLSYSVTVGDFNGDGKADLVTANAGSNTVTVLLGNGDGTFTAPLTIPVGTDPIFAATGDFNGDGLTDVAAVDNYPNYIVTVLIAQETQTATATANNISPSGSGTHQVEASYPGNSNYGPSVSPTVGLTAFMPPSFTISGTAVTVAPGATTGNTSTITVTPSGGFTGAVALTAAISSGPAGAQQSPIFGFGTTDPVNITGASPATVTLTVSTTAAGGTQCFSANQMEHKVPWYAAGGGTALACVLLLGIPARRRSWLSMFGMVVLLAVLTSGLAACNEVWYRACNTVVISGTTPGTYTVTVSGASGTTTATSVVTVVVQ